MVFIGVTQLIAYRFLNYYVVISPLEVSNIGDLVQYLVTNFALIIRITGQFHIAVGILLLFGFNLPTTNNRYFLASSFTDFWRRANIYWKDFMLKVFYYPAYFALKMFGDTTRLIIATIVVFLLTWAFHSYQWFWLRGSILFTPPDILYWALFGILILVNSIYEVRKGRSRSIGPPKWSTRKTTIESLKMLGVFSTIAILWGLWTSPSIQEYLGLWSVITEPISSISDLLPIIITVSLLVGAKFFYTWQGEYNPNSMGQTNIFFRRASLYSVGLFGIILLGTTAFQSRVSQPAQDFLSSMTESRLSDRDAQLLLRGYYEDLVGVNRFNSELWEIYNKRPSDWPLIQETEAARLTQDFSALALNPSVSLEFHGANFSTNSWGMRDQEYTLVPPANTYRIALVGPSYVMGSGVNDEETFEAILEQHLNTVAGDSGSNYEILNFGVAGVSILQQLYTLDEKALEFSPSAFYVVSHQEEYSTLTRNLANMYRIGAEIPYDFVKEIGIEAGIEDGMPQGEIERRLQQVQEQLTLEAYKAIVNLANENGILPVWVYIPTPDPDRHTQIEENLHDMAAEAGFVVVSLSDVYDGLDLEKLIVAEWDRHPNKPAHRLIAELMYDRMVLEEAIIPVE